MAVAPYIPPKNADLLSWAQNFSTLLTASPSTYGLMSSDAATVAATYAALAAAYALITSSATKTAATVQAFNIQKVTSLSVLRPYAQTIANNAGVAASDKIAIGVNARTTPPTPVPVPPTYPVLYFGTNSNAGQVLRYHDSTNSASVKSKPFGVLQVQIYALVSATVITDPTLLTLQRSVTTSPLQLTLGSGNAGKTAYYAARYITRKGYLSDFGPIISGIVLA
jgi:hypothetical protein